MMGFTPQQVRAMTLAQFGACVQGWNRANGAAPGPDAPSIAEFEAAKRAHGDA